MFPSGALRNVVERNILESVEFLLSDFTHGTGAQLPKYL